jgi:hypothetical protein
LLLLFFFFELVWFGIGIANWFRVFGLFFLFFGFGLDMASVLSVASCSSAVPDGSDVPLWTAASKPWRVSVKIGGDIEVTKKSYSGKLSMNCVFLSFFFPFFPSIFFYSSYFFFLLRDSYSSDDDLVSFFVEFELSCQQKSLRGAHLSAVVAKGDESFDVPVAIGSHGRYQLSWTLRMTRNAINANVAYFLGTKTVSAGDYHINIYRQVDKRSADALPFRTVIHTHVVCQLAVFFSFPFSGLTISHRLPLHSLLGLSSLSCCYLSAVLFGLLLN